MKRDDDFLRQMLLNFEASEKTTFIDPLHLQSPPDELKLSYHMSLAVDAGLLTTVGRGTVRMTNTGHDYLDAIRNEGIWKQTKAAIAETGGSATLEILKTLATGFLRKKLSQHTGLEL